MPSTTISRIDGLTTSVAVKAPCKAVTSAAITLSGEQTVNSTAVVSGDRVLVKDQVDTKTNGIYVVSTGAWTRALDFDGTLDAVTGTTIVVYNPGGANLLYQLTSAADPIVFGTTNLTFALANFGVSTATSVTYQQFASTKVRVLADKVAETISVLDFQGVTGNAADDQGTGLQLAISVAASQGYALYWPRGTYSTATPLVFANNATHYGDCADWDDTLGTVLRYTGTNADGFQINNPINSSTAATISFSDMLFYAPNLSTTGKAAFADTGSTFLQFNRCGFSSSRDCLILDQSEVVTIESCFFQGLSGCRAGLWIVNGADRTVGASSLYTNRLSVRRSQFGPLAGGSMTYGIVDDGGIQHSFNDNNLDGMTTPIRAHGVSGLTINGNEVENWTSGNGFRFLNTKLSGASFGPTQELFMCGNFLLSSLAVACVEISTGDSVKTATLIENEWDNQNAGGSGVSLSGSATMTSFVGMGNRQTGTGLTGATEGNTVNRSGIWTPVITAAGGGFAIGNGTSNGNWTRNGNMVHATVEFGVGGTTNLGTGELSFTLPVATTATKPTVGVGYGLIAAATFIHGAAVLGTTGSSVIVRSGGTGAVPVVAGWSATTPSTAWASGDSVSISISYQIGNAQLL